MLIKLEVLTEKTNLRTQQVYDLDNLEVIYVNLNLESNFYFSVDKNKLYLNYNNNCWLLFIGDKLEDIILEFYNHLSLNIDISLNFAKIILKVQNKK